MLIYEWRGWKLQKNSNILSAWKYIETRIFFKLIIFSCCNLPVSSSGKTLKRSHFRAEFDGSCKNKALLNIIIFSTLNPKPGATKFEAEFHDNLTFFILYFCAMLLFYALLLACQSLFPTLVPSQGTVQFDVAFSPKQTSSLQGHSYIWCLHL